MVKFKDSDHPRGQPDNKGQFVEKDGAKGGEKESGEYSNLPSGRSIVHRAERVVGDIAPISSADYSVIRSEVFKKQSQRGYNKKRDYAYSANDFYVFDNGADMGSFTIRIKLPIVGNEEIINNLWRWLDKNG